MLTVTVKVLGKTHYVSDTDRTSTRCGIPIDPIKVKLGNDTVDCPLCE